MAIELTINKTQANTAANQADVSLRQAPTQTQPGAILAGDSVTVVSAAATDLEKLVARVKNESDDKRTSIAKLRISVVMTLLDAMNVEMNNAQKAAFTEILTLDEEIGGNQAELEALYATYGISDGNAASAAMDALIDSLEQAVERAVQEGKDHNKQVKAAKEQRDADQAKLDRLQNAEQKDEAAIQAAKAALDASQAALDAANALVANDASTIAAAKSALADAKRDQAHIGELQSAVASASAKQSACMTALGDKALAIAAAALSARADAVDTSNGAEVEENPDKAQRKEDEKAANDPLAIIRESINRLEETVLKTIEENRELKA
ncbi:MAG: hypothetical protein J6U40_07030 [Kiritimatiellae bacterium]|nr:hypothetical protein [Kiritimatiellia bacterium]